ncbi:hypothetical protein M0G74_18050 [Microbulbifer sp. CAU 1566]|uniref:hypothetical protein n=1 Tax=Microbulbifer sp. CAU 1566 TaxID=2933269 RepID=UPI002004128B|nr:hypothetical protein [Microbulbifer sp. CAU 1566]MCK7599181.1 hypothetical protein [Microbulbifer sp. CAU 1566]
MNIGVCWYQKDEWEKMRSLSVDPEKLDDDYESWKKNAHETITSLREKGMSVKKVSVKAKDLAEWCNQHGKKVNGEARAAYASFLLDQREARNP